MPEPGREPGRTSPGLSESPAAETRLQPPFHVILLNDNDHTFDYVVEMLGRLFGHAEQRAWAMAWKVHLEGRCVVETTTRERAELKRDQIHAYGRDPRVPRCAGSMSAILEPAAG
jgi:ATP-dependent Clp protease adaptor protein ClpS